MTEFRTTQQMAPATPAEASQVAQMGGRMITELFSPGIDEWPAYSLGLYLAPEGWPTSRLEQAAALGALERQAREAGRHQEPGQFGDDRTKWPDVLREAGFTPLRHVRLNTESDMGEAAVTPHDAARSDSSQSIGRTEQLTQVLSFFSPEPCVVADEHKTFGDQASLTLTLQSGAPTVRALMFASGVFDAPRQALMSLKPRGADQRAVGDLDQVWPPDTELHFGERSVRVVQWRPTSAAPQTEEGT